MANGLVLNVDTTKSEFQNPMVQLRQGDGNYQSLSVTVTSNGEPFDLTDWVVSFMGTTAGSHKIIDANVNIVNALQGTFIYTPTKAWGGDEGEFKNAYFKFVKSDETASGASFRVNVLNAVDLTDEEAKDYISVVDAMIDQVKTDMDSKLADTNKTLSDTQTQANTVQSNVNDLNANVNDLKQQNNNIRTSVNSWSDVNTFNKPIIGELAYKELPDNTDLNTIKLTGDYRGSGIWLNTPTSEQLQSILSVKTQSEFVDQKITQFTEKGTLIYHRGFVNGAWSKWDFNSNGGSNDFVNIQTLGADPTGKNDSTQAFKDATSQDKHTIIVPEGTFLITDTVLFQRYDLVGTNKEKSVLKLSSSDKKTFLQLLYNAKISNLTIDASSAFDGSTAIEMGTVYLDGTSNQYAGAHNNIIDDLMMVSNPDNKNSIGVSLTPHLLKDFENNTSGVFNNLFNNITIDKFGIGLYIDAQKKGWVNGNTFNKITITGYGKYGVWFGQSDVDGQGLQVNEFNSLQLQHVDHTNSDAVGLYISGGTWNNFNDVSHWNDSNYHGTTRPDVIAVKISPDASGSFYSVYDNKISGKTEGTVTADNRISDLNDLNIDILNVENYSKLYGGQMYQSKVKTMPIDNLMTSDIINIYSKTPKLSTLLFNSDDGVKYPQTENDGSGMYIKLPKYTGSSIANISIFGTELQSIKDSGVGTISFKFKTSNEANTPIFNGLYGRYASGAAQDLNPYISRMILEKQSQNEYTVNMVLDFISNKGIIQSLNNIIASIGFSIVTASDYVGLRDIKLSNRISNHYANYTRGHKSNNHYTVVASAPSSWANVGVFPVDPGNFQTFNNNVVSYHNLDSNILVETVFKN